METEADRQRWNLLQNKVQRSNVAAAFELFRLRGIEPILIKGLAAGLNYPETESRHCSDIDLAVSPAEVAPATVAVAEFRNRQSIDIHEGLRHLDTLDWTDLFTNSMTVDVEGVPVRMLRPEDHLRVLCVHWLNDGGAYRERLWDIYYAVNGRPADFDWDRCLNVVSPTRRRWIICTIGLAHNYLGLDLKGLSFENEALRLPDWLLRALEREWASDVRLTPIHSFLNDPGGLLKQIRKRFPPNPIQATIDVEGSFDARSRIFYQFGSILKRLVPSVKRVAITLRARFR